MIREAPRIETERLVLRPIRREDFRPYHAILQQPAVHRHFGPEPMGQEECWRRIVASSGSWGLIGFGGWMVERRSDQALIGTISLFNGWRELEPEFGDDPEMGWIFTTEVHGMGMAGEACRAALDWADDHLQPTPIWAIIAPANAPSIALTERLGFVHHSETLYNKEPILVLRRPPTG